MCAVDSSADLVTERISFSGVQKLMIESELFWHFSLHFLCRQVWRQICLMGRCVCGLTIAQCSLCWPMMYNWRDARWCIILPDVRTLVILYICMHSTHTHTFHNSCHFMISLSLPFLSFLMYLFYPQHDIFFNCHMHTNLWIGVYLYIYFAFQCSF